MDIQQHRLPGKGMYTIHKDDPRIPCCLFCLLFTALSVFLGWLVLSKLIIFTHA